MFPLKLKALQEKRATFHEFFFSECYIFVSTFFLLLMFLDQSIKLFGLGVCVRWSAGGLGLVGLLVAWAGPANNSNIPSKRHNGRLNPSPSGSALFFWPSHQHQLAIHRSNIHIHRGCCLLACLSAVVHSSNAAQSHS